jgi:hypothetical protein
MPTRADATNSVHFAIWGSSASDIYIAGSDGILHGP